MRLKSSIGAGEFKFLPSHPAQEGSGCMNILFCLSEVPSSANSHRELIMNERWP
jgi:hypothetical protein